MQTQTRNTDPTHGLSKTSAVDRCRPWQPLLCTQTSGSRSVGPQDYSALGHHDVPLRSTQQKKSKLEAGRCCCQPPARRHHSSMPYHLGANCGVLSASSNIARVCYEPRGQRTASERPRPLSARPVVHPPFSACAARSAEAVFVFGQGRCMTCRAASPAHAEGGAGDASGLATVGATPLW